ncbi:MAG: hypothetical protein LPH21_07425 [Shewanella sp.]|nr:hypothetical protein [Shewanella sp.]
MLIIGLVGSTEARREEMAAKLSKAGKAQLGVFSLKVPRDASARLALLSSAIKGFGGKGRDWGLVLSHVTTLKEAEFIRARGGFLLHLEGRVSGEISIQRGDLMVTSRLGGYRHYLDPVEALSELTSRNHSGTSLTQRR